MSTKTRPTNRSPFTRATNLSRRLKLLIWGEFGAGKTTLALGFPRPAVIDLEGGTDLYGGSFEFDVLRAKTPDEVMGVVNWLHAHEHEYRTLVIDPITVYWEALQRKWSDIFLQRNEGSKGHHYEYYDFQPRDWMTIKAELKELVRKLIALDMNVVVTARQKTKYADGSYMRAIGETFDGEKGLPYMFDTILRLYRDDQNRVMGQCVKDRTNTLPKEAFECSYQALEQLIGRESLRRKAEDQPLASQAEKSAIRDHLEALDVPPDQVTARLAAYGAKNLDDLSKANAKTILSKLESAVSSRRESQVGNTQEN